MTELRDRLEQLAASPITASASEIFEGACLEADGIRRHRRRGRALSPVLSAAVVAAIAALAIHAVADHGDLKVATSPTSDTTASSRPVPIAPQYEVDTIVVQATPAAA